MIFIVGTVQVERPNSKALISRKVVPIAVGDSIRICLAFSAEHSLILFVIDIHNALQNKLISVNERVYLHPPLYYLLWFKQYYPNYKLPSTKTFYILQSIHAIQDTKPAGKQWHDMIKQFFSQIWPQTKCNRQCSFCSHLW